MATCPHCFGALTDDHRCPRKRHLRVVTTVIGTLGGALAGFVAMAAIDPAQRSTEWDLWVIPAAALAGGVACYRLSRR